MDNDGGWVGELVYTLKFFPGFNTIVPKKDLFLCVLGEEQANLGQTLKKGPVQSFSHHFDSGTASVELLKGP